MKNNLKNNSGNYGATFFFWSRLFASVSSFQKLTHHLTGWTALCALLYSREQGSVEPTASRRVTVSREGVGVCPLPNDWRFTSQGRAVYLLPAVSLLTGNYDSTQSLGFPLIKGKAEGLVLAFLRPA